MQPYWKMHKTPILLVLGSVLFYSVFAYNLSREDFLKLLCLFVALGFVAFKLIQFEKWNFQFLLGAGILFRLVFLLATPNLSQDFYRFIWDGELIAEGINPYLFTPNELIATPNFQIPSAEILHEGMGSLSARHYSNYPPVNQFIFAISSFLGFGSVLGSVIWMRLFIIAADIGIVHFGRKLLQNFNLSPHLIFWFFLNPLVLIELTGNLHFEGVMLFFFVWALYLISKGNLLLAAPIYAASIMLKLVPLLFLPLFLNFLGFKKSFFFYSVTLLSCLLFTLPFYDPSLLDNYSKTIGLWFTNFQFNSGVYALVKSIVVGTSDIKPWEFIKTYGTFVKAITLTLLLVLAFFKKQKNLKSVVTSMFLVLSTYYLLSSTVHPWYIIFLLVLGTFTNYRFALLWSILVILSYFTYSQPNFQENSWILILEYLTLFLFIIYELVKKNNNLLTIREK